MKRFLLLLVATLAMAQGPVGTVSTIVVRKQTVLAGAAEVVTVQMPSTVPTTGPRAVKFLSAAFDCTVACSFTLERNGSAATTVSLTPLNANPQEPPPITVAFNTSNSAGGSVIGSYNCAAACPPVPIDLTGIWFNNASVGTQNLTLRSNSITGTVDIMFKYQETQ